MLIMFLDKTFLMFSTWRVSPFIMFLDQTFSTWRVACPGGRTVGLDARTRPSELDGCDHQTDPDHFNFLVVDF